MLEEATMLLKEIESLRDIDLELNELKYLFEKNRINHDFLNGSIQIKLTLCKNDDEKNEILKEAYKETGKIIRAYEELGRRDLKVHSKRLLQKTKVEFLTAMHRTNEP